MELDKRQKIIAVISLLGIIFVCLSIIITNKDIFNQKVIVTEPNGCEKIYINGKLVNNTCLNNSIFFNLTNSADEYYGYNK